MSDPFGFLVVDKAPGMTSHDVVAKIRRTFKLKKVGHAGTLDPMATGVLVICIGQATRLSEYAMASQKRYRATVFLGVATDSYDAEGEIISIRPSEHITREDVENVLPSFTGEIAQVPPMHSAIKRGGRKLYELAREGTIVAREPRMVTIESITLERWHPPEFVLDVVCSPGTYIRSLAHDIGEVLEVGAHLSGLIRVSSGSFHIDDAVTLPELLDDPGWMHQLKPPDAVLGDMPPVSLSAEDTDNVCHGRAIDGDAETAAFLRAYDPEGHFIAILRVEGSRRYPHKVFLTSSST